MFIETDIIVKLLLASLLGALIGFERKSKALGLGIRTSLLIALSSCVFTLTTLKIFDPTNIARIAQGLLAGIGFIGAAIIWREKSNMHRPHGLTTAVTVWCITAIGFAVGAGFYFIALFTTLIILIVLIIKKLGIE